MLEPRAQKRVTYSMILPPGEDHINAQDQDSNLVADPKDSFLDLSRRRLCILQDCGGSPLFYGRKSEPSLVPGFSPKCRVRRYKLFRFEWGSTLFDRSDAMFCTLTGPAEPAKTVLGQQNGL